MRRDGLKITQLIDKLLSVVGRQPHPDAMMNDIAYEIMGIPAPETRWELLPLLRRHCNGMIIDAMWTLLYNRWLFIEVWESHKEIVEWMFKHHTIQQPARRSSEGKKIPGAHVTIDEYFYTAPYMAASHMRSFGKPRLIVDIQPESWLRDQTFGPFPAPGTAQHPLALGTARVPALSAHLFEPDADEPYGDMYPRIWSLCRQLVKGQEMAWNTYMETRSNFLQMARSYVQASDLARPGNSLDERALARLHAEGVVVQARLNEIVRIGLLEEPWSLDAAFPARLSSRMAAQTTQGTRGTAPSGRLLADRRPINTSLEAVRWNAIPCCRDVVDEQGGSQRRKRSILAEAKKCQAKRWTPPCIVWRAPPADVWLR